MKMKVVFFSVILSGLFVSYKSSAIPVNLTMSGSPPFTGSSQVIANNDSPSNFGDGTVLDWMQKDIAAYDATYSAGYATPTGDLTGAPLLKVTTGSGPDSIDLSLGSYDYLFFHWGGKGGGWSQVFYVGGDTGTFTFNAPPGGHPDVGGLSFYSFYGPTPSVIPHSTVPDGGSSVLMLGAALTGLSLVVRRSKK